MLTVVLQAGGESRRMGRDKALIPFLGRPLIQRVKERVESLADEILVTTNHPQDYQFLGLPLFSDLWPTRGALGGLLTALQVANQPLVAVVACDMPFVSAAILNYLKERLIETHADLAIPRTPQGWEPFHAIYRRSTCLPLVRSALQAGKHKIVSWFDQAQLCAIASAELEQFDPTELAFLNINTPQELRQAEAQARQMQSPYRQGSSPVGL